MAFYFSYQQRGGEETWQVALADHRAELVRDKRPAFVTVLDVDAVVESTFTKEQLEALRYRGPMYYDWDGPLEEVIEKVKEFAEKLRALGVNLNCVRWFATGGRGVHAEIPQEVFIDKVPAKGYQYLPAIYKEVLYETYTDCMDLKVYSGRRGRMWRTPGVQRDNGLYKVPLSAAEVESLDVKTYQELCVAPRFVEVAAPVFSYQLALIFSKSQQKIETALKNRKPSAGNKNLLARFGGKFPPTLQRVLAGENINPDAGFHSIALQIGITANALGISEETVLSQCDGLVNNHASTGTRYNTPDKRRNELARLIRYTADNPCYEFSRGGIMSICALDADTSDLEGATESTGKETIVPGEDANGLLGTISMRENGIFCKDAEGLLKAISNVSFEDICVIKTLPEGSSGGEVWGFEADVKVKGKKVGRKTLENSTFSSKAKFNDFAMKVSGLMAGTDNQTNAITQLLHQSAESSGRIQYIIRREGLDLIRNPDTKRFDLVWVGGGSVLWTRNKEQVPYVYKGVNGPQGLFRSHLHETDMLFGSPDELEILRSMLKMNDPSQLAKLIGWLTSAFHRRLYHRATGQFPLCHVFGQAGSGKTQTSLLLAGMHYEPTHEMNTINADSLSPFAVQRYVINSASMPVIIDEYKPRQMGAIKVDALRTMFNGVYNDAISSRGGGDDSGGAKDYRILTQETLSAPVMFIAEGAEAMSSIKERALYVNMSKGGIAGREEHYNRVYKNRAVLSRLGKTMLIASMTIPVDDGVDQWAETRLDPARKEAREILGEAADARPVFSYATCLAGFDFFADCVRSVFGSKLDEEMAVLRDSLSIKDPEQEASRVTVVMAEATKVIDCLAFMSKAENSFSPHHLADGKDYAFTEQGNRRCLDLNMQSCYIKYVSWAKAKGQEVLYDNYEQFYNGLANYKPRKNLYCLDSPLKVGEPKLKVYRFDLAQLSDEGAGEFKGQ